MSFLGITKAGIFNVLPKVAGGLGLALVAYDSHTAGKINGPAYEKSANTAAIEDAYLEHLKLGSPSATKSEFQKQLFKFKMDENISPFFSHIKGYFGGFCSMLVDNVIPLGLSLGALLSRKGGLLSKAFGIGLVAYGGIFVMQEILGIGKSKI